MQRAVAAIQVSLLLLALPLAGTARAVVLSPTFALLPTPVEFYHPEYTPPYASGTVNGISGGLIYGSLQVPANFIHVYGAELGFVFDGQKTTLLPGTTDILGASGSDYLVRTSVSNANRYVYDGITFTLINNSQWAHTYARAISGDTVVGSYSDAHNALHGFVYDGTSYSTLDDPLGVGGTDLAGFFHGGYVGDYTDASGAGHVFFSDGSTFSSLLNPLNSQWNISVIASDGNTVLGRYQTDAAGDTGFFVYDGTTLTPFSIQGDPGLPTGISGSTIVGSVTTNSLFTVTIPEPPSLMLAVCGAAALFGLVLYRNALPIEPSHAVYDSRLTTRRPVVNNRTPFGGSS